VQRSIFWRIREEDANIPGRRAFRNRVGNPHWPDFGNEREKSLWEQFPVDTLTIIVPFDERHGDNRLDFLRQISLNKRLSSP
jgi:hypothetical protein